MVRRRILGAALVVAGIILVGLGFLTQECSLNNPIPPSTTAPPTCTRPAFPLALVYWLPGVLLTLLGAVLYRRGKSK